MQIHISAKRIPIKSVTIEWADIKRIYERLSEHVAEQGDREIAELVRPPDTSEEEFDQYKQSVRERAFRVTVSIFGKDGSSLFGDSVELFDSPNLPDTITQVFMTNSTAYQGVANIKPTNFFELNLDFSKPPLLDGENLVSSPTPNFSNVNIEGVRAWVAAISEAVMGGVLDNRKNNRTLIHRAFVYDLGLMLFGIPIGLYTCWKFSEPIELYLGSLNSFVSAAAYIFLMLLVIWLYRLFFGYTKWAFPTVELKDSEAIANRHRNFWYAIIVGLVGKVIWDIFV